MKTTAPNNTHIAKVRSQQASGMQQVMDLLSWSRERYCQEQFRQYCAFVEAITEGWPKVREEILYSPIFRGFWNNEWARRDREDFLSFATEMDDAGFIYSEYLYINDHERLLGDDDFMTRYSQVFNLIRHDRR